MSILLPDRRIDALVAGYQRYVLFGLALLFVAHRLNGFCAIPAFAAIWLGACGGSLQAWRTERGLWMLSGFFLAISLAVYSLLQYAAVVDMLHNRRPPAPIAIDASLGMALLFVQTRLLLTVTIRNRHVPIHEQDA